MRKVGKFFSIAFCLIYFLIFESVLLLMFAASFFERDYYAKVFKDIELHEIIVADLADEELIDKYGEDATLEEVLVDNLKEAGLSEDISMEIINKDKVKEVVGTFVGDYVNYVTNDGELPKISKSDVREILNDSDIEDLIEGKYTKEEILDIIDELNEHMDEIVEKEGV